MWSRALDRASALAERAGDGVGGLIDGALVWYTDDNACVPLDIVALEHATIGTVDGCAPPMTDEGPRSNRARAPDARPPR